MNARPDKVPDQEAAIAKLIESLGEAKGESLKLMSDLDDEEIKALSILYTYSKLLGLKSFKEIADNFLKLRASKFRLGRREVALIAILASGGMLPRGKSLKDILSMRI